MTIKITKSKVITDLMKMKDLKPLEEIVMVGDTPYDIAGGKEKGISTIAVGFKIASGVLLFHPISFKK